MKRYTCITNKDRKIIEELWKNGHTPKDIADKIGVSHSTICRELKRGFDGTALEAGRCGYSAEVAIKDAALCETRKQEARHRERKQSVRRRKKPFHK